MYKIFPLAIFLLVFQTTAFAKNVEDYTSEKYFINYGWFENFNDPRLTEYIRLALENNKDIVKAKKTIKQYRQEKNIKISKEFPDVNVGADYVLAKIPKTTIPRNQIKTNSFALPFYTSWEIDYLLKNYNKIQQAKLEIENKKADLKSTQLIIMSDVAEAYLNISNLNRLIEIEKKILNLRKDILKRKEKMFRSGVLSKSELNFFETLFEEENSNLSSLMKQKHIYLTELSYLLAKTPLEIEELVITPFEEISYEGNYPKYLEGSIIFNRPDIIKLENEIKKSKLDILIAKKEFFPKINVQGGLIFTTLSGNFGWDTAVAGLIAGAAQNIFDGGKKIFNLKEKKTIYEIQVENYLNQNISALKEIDDLLYSMKEDIKIHENNEKKLKIENDNFIRIFKSLNSGRKSYPDYLTENIEKNSLEKTASNSKVQIFVDLISLFKATGGGL